MIQIIPAIDIIDGRCVRLSQGDYKASTEYCELPSEMARRFADHGITRLHAVDLNGARAGKPMALRTLESIANAVSDMVIEWGGGVKTDGDVNSARDAGASCIVAGSIAVKQPDVFLRWLCQYGPDAISLGADARDGMVAISGWLEDTDISISQLIARFTDAGLNQAIVTDIAKDGMLQGPNTELYTQLQSQFPDVDITVSGGISSIDDIIRLNEASLRRVIVGKAIYEGRISLSDLEKLIIS